MGCMAYTVREETDMKIPASKVPAQVWADKAAKRDDLNYAEVECLGKWGSSKQVYRVDSTLWNELAADDGVEMPTVVFEKLPYDCVFIQRGGTSRLPSSFGTLERERAGYYIHRRIGWMNAVEGPRRLISDGCWMIMSLYLYAKI